MPVSLGPFGAPVADGDFEPILVRDFSERWIELTSLEKIAALGAPSPKKKKKKE